MGILFRTAVAVAAIILIATGLYFAVEWNLSVLAVGTHPKTSIVDIETTGVSLAAADGVPSNYIDKIGTIVFYVQQGQEVPYFFYTVNGNVNAKALYFPSDGVCVTSVEAPCSGSADAIKARYGSGPVRITGIVNSESLTVSGIGVVPS
jgi:hypothetical protein